MYQVGDRVVHPMHGAGIIESIVQERLGGQLSSYYVFRMPSGGLTLKIPTGSCGAIGVRALSTSGRIREVLGAIPGLEIDRTTNWNRRYRENLDRLKSGDLLEVARVIKGLMWRDREKGLSNGERKMLHSAKQILVSEVVLVEGHTYPDAEQRIEQAMMTGAKNE
ncbi:MAG: CarD family transcriptional regulator [Firmicutes bacterium]|nr:CarD family transcriptional regulator [Bacillota bacterium]